MNARLYKGGPMSYIIALDQGTTSSRAIIFDHQQTIVDVRQNETRQYFPHPGWVEQDPQDIWATTFGVLQETLAATGIDPRAIDALAITNQRETTIVWDKKTGKPVYNAIVWIGSGQRPATSSSERWTPGSYGSLQKVVSTPQTTPTRAAPCSLIFMTCVGMRKFCLF